MYCNFIIKQQLKFFNNSYNNILIIFLKIISNKYFYFHNKLYVFKNI